MKKSKNTIFFLTALLFLIKLSAAQQSDITSETKQNMPNDWGKKPGEIQQYNGNDINVPQNLMDEYNHAKETFNDAEKTRLGNEIIKYFPVEKPVIQPGEDKPEQISKVPAPYNTDWYNSDVLSYTGDVAYTGGHRQLDLKQGEDGWLYLAVNQRNVSGLTGTIRVYRSSNAGINWSFINGVDWTNRYIQSFSMLVENRSANNSVGDSTKIILYYTTSLNSSFNDSRLEVVIFNRNGQNWDYNIVSNPGTGNKYEYPSACSDGQYFSTATYMHCVVREVSNSGATQVGLRHFYSVNWIASHTSSLLNTGFNDNYPSIQYGEKNGNDSIYIAVERRLTATEYEIRVLATPEFSSTNYYTYFITNASTGTRYEKPQLTVVQQNFALPKRMLITCTKNNIALYDYSTNGGNTWGVDLGLSTVGLRDFTWCASDSNTTNGGYIIAATVDQIGDSVTIRRGIPGNLGATLYKRNSIQSTGLLAPVCAIQKTGTTLNSSFAYAGIGPINVYFNSEQLITGIQPINNIPAKFGLSQNYPNPFNPATKIKFAIPSVGNAYMRSVQLKIYDILGNEITTLINQQLQPGSYEIQWNAANYPSGVYFYRIKTEEFTQTKKLMLIK